jgi:hypothetical protein
MVAAHTPSQRFAALLSPAPPILSLGGALRVLILAAALGLAGAAGMLPPDQLPLLTWPDGAPVSDEALHLLGFSALGLLFGALFRRALLGFIGLLLFGTLLEGAQGLSGLGREADLFDALANALGVTTGLLAVSAQRWLWSIVAQD